MYKVLALNNISSTGLQRFPAEQYDVKSDTVDPEVILLRSHNMHDMELPSSLLVVGRAGAGVNNIPVAELSQRGVPVFNTPGANANAVKELVIAGMLLACRNICQSWSYTRELEADDEELETLVEAGKKRFVGYELAGRTLGVIGLGAIGVKVANTALALGMNVLGYDPAISVRRAWELSAEVEEASLAELMKRCDFITVHVPLVDATRDLINADNLSLVQSDLVMLNFSRAGIINDEALLAALDNQQLSAYVSDFPSNLIKNHPQVITLPHLGASTHEAQENCAKMVVDQVRRYLEIGAIRNSVNLPDVKLSNPGENKRVCIINDNVPNMVGQITAVLADAGVNIVELTNKSKADLAYTVIDIDTAITANVQQQMHDIEGVHSVRVI